LKKILACAALFIAALGQNWTLADAQKPPALNELAGALGDQISRGSPEGPVGIYSTADSPELARAFATLVASELAKRRLAPIALQAASLDEAETAARRSGARALARLSLTVEGGVLRARGDLLGTWVNFWSGAARTRPAQPAAILNASAPADAQVLAMITGASRTGRAVAAEAELTLEGATLAKLALPPAAVATADLDGDGKDEILALTDEELLIFSPDGKVIARREHRLLPASATPCREPFGGLLAQSSPPRVAYYSAARRKGELLQFDSKRGSLEPIAALDDAPLAAATQLELWGRFTEGQNTFGPRLRLNQASWMAPAPFTAISFFQAGGAPRWLMVFPDGSALWSPDLHHIQAGVRLQDLGSASALVDVDGDGEAELVTTSSQPFPAPDELRILTAPINAQRLGRLRWRGPVLRGRALQVAPARFQPGEAKDIVVGVWLPDGTGELQVFRRVVR
jgi:hypothetical protein